MNFLKSLAIILVLIGLCVGLYYLLFDGYFIKAKETREGYEVATGLLHKEIHTYPKTAQNKTLFYAIEAQESSIKTRNIWLVLTPALVVTSPILKWHGLRRRLDYPQMIIGTLIFCTVLYFVIGDYQEALENIKAMKP